MLGNIINKYRKQQKLTLKDLSAKSGLSIGYISQLERGLVEPSINSLRKLADVLDVPITLLFDKQPADILTIRNGKHFLIRNNDETMLYEILTPLPSAQFIPKSLMIKFTIQPHSSISELPVVHFSEELVYVLSGKLNIELENEVIVLYPGDSSVIRENIPHTFSNDGDEATVGISSMTPPVWGQSGL